MTGTEPTRPTGEPRLASVASWAVLAASFGLSATTWVALARLAGFTGGLSIPGTGASLAMAWLMPIAVDGYVVVALVLWMAPVPTTVAAFAKKNTYGAAGIGIAAQSAYHLLFTLSESNEAWRVVLAAIVGALPPAVAGLAVHMRALIRRESSRDAATSGPVPAASLSVTPITELSTTDTAAPPSASLAVPNPSPSTPDESAGPAPTPGPAPVEIPTPAQVVTRISPPATTSRPTTPAPYPNGLPAPTGPGRQAAAPRHRDWHRPPQTRLSPSRTLHNSPCRSYPPPCSPEPDRSPSSTAPKTAHRSPPDNSPYASRSPPTRPPRHSRSWTSTTPAQPAPSRPSTAITPR